MKAEHKVSHLFILVNPLRSYWQSRSNRVHIVPEPYVLFFSAWPSMYMGPRCFHGHADERRDVFVDSPLDGNGRMDGQH